MISLLVALITLLLLVVLAGITLFYGGQVWSGQGAASVAVGVANQASQLRSALLLYGENHADQYPAVLTDLQPAYLQTLPVVPADALTRTGASWAFRGPAGLTVWLSGVRLAVCDAVNLRAGNSWPGIPKFLDVQRSLQCLQTPSDATDEFTVVGITKLSPGLCAQLAASGVNVPCTENGVPPTSAGDPAYVPVPDRVGDLRGTPVVYRVAPSSSVLDFYGVPVNQLSSDQVVYVRNTGTGPVFIGAVTTQRGAYDSGNPLAAGPYELWSACEGAYLLPGDSCPVQVMYNAVATPLARDSDQLAVLWEAEDQSSSGTAQVALVADSVAGTSAIGVGGHAVAAGADYVVNFASLGQTRLVDLYPLAGQPILYAADESAPFEIVDDNCTFGLAGYQFATGTYCTLTIKLTSTATPANYDRPLVLSSNAEVPMVWLRTNLAGSNGVLQLTAPESFPATARNAPQPQRTAEVRNIGGGPLTVQSVSVALPYEVVGNDCVPTVAAAASCTLTVALHTTTAGSYYNVPLTVVTDGGTDSVLLDGQVLP